MWRYPFLNLSFVVIAITLFAGQHSLILGPAARGNPYGLTRANLDETGAFLHDIWRRGMVLNEWLTECRYFQWQTFNASSAAENDLIEARFHVANAEVFTEAVREEDRALQELVRAETSLQAVRRRLAANLAPELAIIRNELSAAEAAERADAAFAAVPFETIKANLDHLIKAVRLSKT
jgi:hypothetical protein